MNASKPIPGFAHYSATEDGDIINSKGKTLKPYLNKWGYQLVTLCTRGKKHRKSVHRLIMLAFCGPSKLPVDHIDYDKTNNRIGNLRYLSYSENNKRCFTDGRRTTRGMIVNEASRATRALCILRLGGSGMRNMDAAKLFRVSPATVSDITAGRTWKTINQEATKQ
jgi:hypothetical protein